MSFKIVITDNENGKELVNIDNAKAIIGEIVDDENTNEMCFCRCNSLHIASVVSGASGVVSKIKNKNPEIGLLLKLKEVFGEDNE
jgi:hypothetical protein